MPNSSAPLTPHTIKIGNSVPLPGHITGKRLVELDLGLDPATDFLAHTRSEGEKYADAAGVSAGPTGIEIDEKKAVAFLRQRLLEIGYSGARVDRSVAELPQLLSGLPKVVPLARRVSGENDAILPTDDETVIVDPVLGDPLDLVREFALNARVGKLVIPGKNAAGGGTTGEVPDKQKPDPQLFIVEVYGISSFLGDYGIGKAVRTFSLLPGESTTIRLKTWQSSKTSIKHSSSIIDSHEQSARERFADSVQKETTDKKTKSKSLKWRVEAEADASWGFGSASIKASAEGEYHSGREQFSKAVSDSVAEHAREASSKRELSVSSSSESEIETGQEQAVEREISNVNMRRVLNFVFRELNQIHVTKTHLKDIQIAYTNGLSGTWRQVPVSGLRQLLAEVLEPAIIDEVAKRILKVVSTVFDGDGIPVRVLERVTYDPVTDQAVISPLVLNADGSIDPPQAQSYYRFMRGALNQSEAKNPVDGVLQSRQEITMRTDSVLVEALLGEEDALDNYAMEIQQAAASTETLKNRRDEIILDALEAIVDPEARAKAAALLFGEKDEEN